MAVIAKIVSEFNDKGLKKAETGFAGFKAELKKVGPAISAAEGGFGKMKAGISGIGSALSAAVASPALLAGGLAAAGGAAIKVATDFSNLGVEVGNFSTATGLSVDSASRWHEVAGDLNIDVATLQTAFGKMNKAVDPKVFADLGIEIAKTNTGAMDVNKTFLNAIDRLHGMKDAGDQAKAGAKLFGRGWQSVAELVGMSTDEIQKRLAGVGKDKIFDDKKIAQARQFRDLMASFGDQVEAVSLELGQAMVPVLEDVLHAAEPVFKVFSFVLEKYNDLQAEAQKPKPGFWAQLWGDATKGPGDIARDVAHHWKVITSPFRDEETPAAILGISKGISKVQYAEDLAARGARVLADRFSAVASSAAEARDRFSEAKQRLKDLNDEISGKKNLVDLQISLRANAAALADLKVNFEEGKISAEDYWLKVQSLALDSQQQVADYATAVGNIPAEKVTQITATMDPSNPDKIFNDLQQWFNGRSLFVSVASGNIADSSVRNAQEGRGGGGGASATQSNNGPRELIVHNYIGGDKLSTLKIKLDGLDRGTR